MAIRYNKLLPVVACSIALTGCVTTLDVSKVESGSTASGLRYYLPQPFLKVTPTNEGGVNVEVVYLPDPENMYAINTASWLGKYTIDVNRTEEGFLETVTFNADGSGVAKQLVDSSASLAAEKLKIDAAEKAEKEKNDKEEAKAKAAKVAALEQAVSNAEIALEIKQRQLASLENRISDPQNEFLIAALLAVEEAQVNYQVAVDALEGHQAETDSANAPLDASKTDSSRLRAPAPIFLKVVMGEDITDSGVTIPSVELVHTFGGTQLDLLTWKIPEKKPEPKKPIAQEYSFALGYSKTVRKHHKTGVLETRILPKLPINGIVEASLFQIKNGTEVDVSDKMTISRVQGGALIVVSFDDNIEAGNYRVFITSSYGAKDEEAEVEEDIRIIK